MTQNETLQNDDLIWIGVDLDKTIAHSEYPDFELREPVEGAKMYLDKLTEDGFKIIIYTARGYADYHKIESWLVEHGIPFRRIICGKPLVRFMIDDRNLEFNGSWSNTYQRLKNRLL